MPSPRSVIAWINVGFASLESAFFFFLMNEASKTKEGELSALDDVFVLLLAAFFMFLILPSFAAPFLSRRYESFSYANVFFLFLNTLVFLFGFYIIIFFA